MTPIPEFSGVPEWNANAVCLSRKMLNKIRNIQKSNYSLISNFNRSVNPTETSYVALVGEDDKGIVSDFIVLNHGFLSNGGCFLFPKIEGKTVSKAIIQLVKKGLKPCGVIMSSPRYHRGSALQHAIDGGLQFFTQNKEFKCFTISDRLKIQSLEKRIDECHNYAEVYGLNTYNWVTVD